MIWKNVNYTVPEHLTSLSIGGRKLWDNFPFEFNDANEISEAYMCNIRNENIDNDQLIFDC